MNKKGKIPAIVTGSCPRCRKGKMFQHGAFTYTKFRKTNKHCQHCGLRFEIEPGFFQGALYVSYLFSVITFFLCGFGTYYFLGDPPLSVYLLVVVVAVIILLPFSYRFSRILFMYWFSGVKFDEKYM